MLLSASLALVAFLIWVGATGTVLPYARFILLGMLASFIGDLVMAKVLPVPDRLIGGMLAFGCAHLLYIRGYAVTVHASGASMLNAGLTLGLLFYLLATLGVWVRWIRNPQQPFAVNLGALVYGSWIGVMAACALGLAVGLGGAWWLTALGGLLFVVSDLLIGITDIGTVRIGRARDWVWLTYVSGQMGIVYAGELAG